VVPKLFVDQGSTEADDTADKLGRCFERQSLVGWTLQLMLRPGKTAADHACAGLLGVRVVQGPRQSALSVVGAADKAAGLANFEVPVVAPQLHHPKPANKSSIANAPDPSPTAVCPIHLARPRAAPYRPE